MEVPQMNTFVMASGCVRHVKRVPTIFDGHCSQRARTFTNTATDAHPRLPKEVVYSTHTLDNYRFMRH